MANSHIAQSLKKRFEQLHQDTLEALKNAIQNLPDQEIDLVKNTLLMPDDSDLIRVRIDSFDTKYDGEETENAIEFLPLEIALEVLELIETRPSLNI